MQNVAHIIRLWVAKNKGEWVKQHPPKTMNIFLTFLGRRLKVDHERKACQKPWGWFFLFTLEYWQLSSSWRCTWWCTCLGTGVHKTIQKKVNLRVHPILHLRAHLRLHFREHMRKKCEKMHLTLQWWFTWWYNQGHALHLYVYPV